MSIWSSLSTVLGGIGLFLLGMALMTDGLKALAGARLRDHLLKLTRRPRDAVLTGAAITAMVQSSSATTLATIGFVSAGLLPFSTSIGVIVGANIGTTSTGWLVALLGLKFSVAKLAMPIVGFGALLRLIGHDRVAHAGATAAGFGMIFIGIDFLQLGMEGMADRFDPARYAGEGFGARLLLVGIGLLMTVIMQSSSAAVATTLTALASGALTLDQAAALVIGQNVGTTVTAIIGAIGTTVAARRTAAIHVLFNLITGSVAILILPLFTGVVAGAVDRIAPGDPTLTIAAFHTAFNLLGAALFLPLAPRLAHFVQSLLREKETGLTGLLNRGVRDVPALAVRAARDTLLQCMTRLMWQMSGRLGGIPAPTPAALDEIRLALPQISTFLARIPPQASSAAMRQRQIDLMRCVDHLTEVIELLDEKLEPTGIRHAGFMRMREHCLKVLDAVRRDLHDSAQARPGRLKHLKQSIAQSRYGNLSDAAVAGNTTDTALLTELMQLQHWIEQIVYHFWRTLKHLDAAREASQAPDSTDEMPPRAA